MFSDSYKQNPMVWSVPFCEFMKTFNDESLTSSTPITDVELFTQNQVLQHPSFDTMVPKEHLRHSRLLEHTTIIPQLIAYSPSGQFKNLTFQVNGSNPIYPTCNWIVARKYDGIHTCLLFISPYLVVSISCHHSKFTTQLHPSPIEFNDLIYWKSYNDCNTSNNLLLFESLVDTYGDILNFDNENNRIYLDSIHYHKNQSDESEINMTNIHTLLPVKGNLSLWYRVLPSHVLYYTKHTIYDTSLGSNFNLIQNQQPICRSSDFLFNVLENEDLSYQASWLCLAPYKQHYQLTPVVFRRNTNTEHTTIHLQKTANEHIFTDSFGDPVIITNKYVCLFHKTYITHHSHTCLPTQETPHIISDELLKIVEHAFQCIYECFESIWSALFYVVSIGYGAISTIFITSLSIYRYLFHSNLIEHTTEPNSSIRL
jgi:hypothetical protein